MYGPSMKGKMSGGAKRKRGGKQNNAPEEGKKVKKANQEKGGKSKGKGKGKAVEHDGEAIGEVMEFY